MTNENRTPAGIPTGGQFAASTKSEAAVWLGGEPGAPTATPPVTAVGDCPDCGEPMIGHVGNGRFVPGASCDHCHHDAMTYEWETEPDEDDRTFLYALQADALIRVTDDDGDTVEILAPDDDTHWDKQVESLGMDPVAFRRAHLAVADHHAFVEAEADRLGYAHMGGVYSIILDRDEVPGHVVLARVGDPRALAADDEDIETAVDRLYIAADCSEENFYDITEQRWSEISAACDEAGLGVMKDIYGSMADREILHRDQVKDADTVTNDYFQVVGPAIDRVEHALLGQA